MNEWLMEKSLNPKQVLTETGVYCVWAENNRFAKIGFSCELSRRLEDLQHAHGEELRLICWFDAGNQKEAYDTEYRLHSRLKHCRGRGEHFLVADPMMTDFLQTLGGIKYLSCRDANRFVDQVSKSDPVIIESKERDRRRFAIEINHIAETISPKLKDAFLSQTLKRQKLSPTE